MKTESEEFNSSFSPGDYGRKILVENDGENRGGKRGVGEIIHRPAKDRSFLNGHVEASEGVTQMTRRERNKVTRGQNNKFLSTPRLLLSASDFSVSPSPLSLDQTVLISCRMKTR